MPPPQPESPESPDAGLLQGFESRQLPAGYLLATPSAAEDRVFMVLSGRLRVYLAGENRSLTLSFLQPGDIYTTHTPTYIETVEPSTLAMMKTADFARRLSVDPSATPVICGCSGGCSATRWGWWRIWPFGRCRRASPASCWS